MLGFVIGDNDIITGFRLVGVEGIEVNSFDQAKQALQNVLARGDVAVVIVSQAFSTQPEMREEIDKVRRERTSPLIVEIPGSRGPSGETRISDLVSKTLGVRL
jgi:V/A-type H+-transporting ATPase subunit F